MENRITRAFRVLLGRPLVGTSVGGTFRLDRGTESEFDHTRRPPFDLAFGGVVEIAPPARVSPGAGSASASSAKATCDSGGMPVLWLTCELRGDGNTWHHLVTLHESNLETMRRVLDDVAAYIRVPV